MTLLYDSWIVALKNARTRVVPYETRCTRPVSYSSISVSMRVYLCTGLHAIKQKTIGSTSKNNYDFWKQLSCWSWLQQIHHPQWYFCWNAYTLPLHLFNWLLSTGCFPNGHGSEETCQSERQWECMDMYRLSYTQILTNYFHHQQCCEMCHFLLNNHTKLISSICSLINWPIFGSSKQ